MAGDAEARRPRLLVLGAGPAQLGLLEAARDRGLHVIVADGDPQAVGFELADERAVVSTEDEPALERLARAKEVDGVISPGADWTVGVAARIAERIGLPHAIDAATAGLVTSKARQRERLAEAGVPQPRLYAPGAEPELPCVVKPADQQGQRGVSVVRSPEELAAAVAAAAGASRGGGYVIEEHVDGPEVTVNAVSVGGELFPLGVTDRLTAEPPAFGVALAHAWPSVHDVRAAVEAARAAATALDVRDGPTYTQIRLGVDGPRVIELAARLGGGHDAELVEAATGVPLNSLAVDYALGRPVSLRATVRCQRTDAAGAGTPASGLGRERGAADTVRCQRWDTAAGDTLGTGSKGACVVFLVAPEGTFRSVADVEEARAMDGVRWVRVYRRPGWRFGPLRRGADRAGAILAMGGSREEALERARRAAEAVRFEVDADPA